MQEQRLQAHALLSVIRKSLWLPLLVLPGLLCTTPVSANNNFQAKPGWINQQKSPALSEQRKLYKQAQQAYKKGQFNKFKRLSNKLNDYPLQPYLEYKSLTRRLKRNPSSLTGLQISSFLQANDNTVIGDKFRLTLIKHAYRTRNWQRLIDVYRPGFGVTSECRYLNALLQTNQSSIANPIIKNLWLSPSSQPRTCDKVFKSWADAGHKSPELIWQRFKLAMSVSNRQLARFLIKSMPRADASVARKWLKVHRNPKLLTSAEILKLKHPEQQAIITHGLKRLSYKDIDAAISTFYRLNKEKRFTDQQVTEITRHIGLRLARKHMPDAGIWLARIPDNQADHQVKEWKIRTAIRQGDWSIVLKSISSLSTEEQADYRWQYWWAYSNEQLGNNIDAEGIYQYLANKRSYYGFLAADHLNQQYAFEDKPVNSSPETIALVNQQPETQRAREFYFMGEILPARREWQRLINRVDTEQKLAASKLAQSWNWHDRAIITMGKTRYRDDITLRFPLQHENKVVNWSSQHNIEPAWTYAIIRRESAFMHDARSSVGAMGLMQLMPNTARQVARQMKIRYRGRNSLLASNTNIRLGTGYLERMLSKLDSQHVLATAAYNAGPHRVEKWLPERYQMDAIRWIETIPFTETREYVSNVFAYMAIYEHRMDKKVTRLSQRMPPVPAKNPPVITQIPDSKQTVQNLDKSTNGPT